MSSNRSYTPVVPAPAQKTGSAQPSHRRELKAPVLVVAAGREWELESGALTIGRDVTANVSVTDPLVSRMHARLVTQANGQVLVEDLQSANGVFVNGAKLSRPSTSLCEGDRLLIGTTEISVFSLRTSATVTTHRGAESRPHVETTLRSPESPASLERIQIPGRRSTITTGRGSPIDMIGQFAEQLMDSGLPLDAVRALSDPLQNLLRGASAGLSVPPQILESATHYALKLRAWTERNTWAEYVLELHLAAKAAPSDKVCDMLEQACKTGAAVDRTLARFLVETIEGREPPPNAEEQLRLRRIELL